MEEKIDKLSRADYEHRLMIKAVWYYYIEKIGRASCRERV